MPTLDESYPTIVAALDERYGSPEPIRDDLDPFEAMVAAVLARSVEPRKVDAALVVLRDAGLLEPEPLAEADENEIGDLFREGRVPLSARAIAPIRRLARLLVDRHGGSAEPLRRGRRRPIRSARSWRGSTGSGRRRPTPSCCSRCDGGPIRSIGPPIASWSATAGSTLRPTTTRPEPSWSGRAPTTPTAWRGSLAGWSGSAATIAGSARPSASIARSDPSSPKVGRGSPAIRFLRMTRAITVSRGRRCRRRIGSGIRMATDGRDGRSRSAHPRSRTFAACNEAAVCGRR